MAIREQDVCKVQIRFAAEQKRADPVRPNRKTKKVKQAVFPQGQEQCNCAMKAVGVKFL